MTGVQTCALPIFTAGTQVKLIPAGDVQALVQQMSEFLEDPQKYVDRARDLQESVARRFTVEGMARAVTDLYERLLQPPR